MGRTKLRSRVVVVVVVLLVLPIAIVTARLSRAAWGQRRLRLPTGNQVPAISLGERHGLILASDGSLWSWGSDFFGWPVLGLGDRAKPSSCLRRIGHETNWVGISAGVSHSLGIKSDGTLWTWGESVHDQLDRPRPISTPVPAASGNDWKQAAAGGIHSIALKRDGTLWGWGANTSTAVPAIAGQIGNNTSTQSFSSPVQIGTLTNWASIWSGNLHFMAIKTDGTLWAWGSNSTGNLGDGTQTNRSSPVQIGQANTWTQIAPGTGHTIALKT